MTRSLATRAASSGDALSKPTAKAMVALVARPARGSTTSALIISRCTSSRICSTSCSRVMSSRSSAYRLCFSMMPSRFAEVMTRWLMTCTRSSAKLVTAERTKSSGTSCCSMRIVPMER